MSLWVVLMVPVSAFAAVVAMAGPQRLAAESTMQEATDDLAAFAAAWRDGHDMDRGELPAFPPECVRSDEQQADLTALRVALQFLIDEENKKLRTPTRLSSIAWRTIRLPWSPRRRP